MFVLGGGFFRFTDKRIPVKFQFSVYHDAGRVHVFCVDLMQSFYGVCLSDLVSQMAVDCARYIYGRGLFGDALVDYTRQNREQVYDDTVLGLRGPVCVYLSGERGHIQYKTSSISYDPEKRGVFVENHETSSIVTSRYWSGYEDIIYSYFCYDWAFK